MFPQWLTPEELIQKKQIGSLKVGEPQTIETLKLCHFFSLDELKIFSVERATKFGTKRFIGIITVCRNGLVVVYPGMVHDSSVLLS